MTHQSDPMAWVPTTIYLTSCRSQILNILQARGITNGSPHWLAVADAAGQELVRRVGGEIPPHWGDGPKPERVPLEPEPVRVPTWRRYDSVAAHLCGIHHLMQCALNIPDLATSNALAGVVQELTYQLAERCVYAEANRCHCPPSA